MRVEIKNISKNINGDKILDSINMTLEGGRIYCLYGENGSGKTMLLRCIAGLIDSSSGEIVCDGKILHKDIDVLPDMGIIIENIGFGKMYTGFENLKILSSINKKISDERIYDCLDMVGLDSKDKRKISKYSLGMRQRLAICQAVMEYPAILLLDEPTNALDDDGVELFRRIVLKEKERGTIVVIASHIKEEVDSLADVRFFMKSGKIVKQEITE